MIVSKSDFVGEYFVSQKLYDDLVFFIEKYEKKYLVRILGAKLYALFISDLDTNVNQAPITQIYKDFFNEILEDSSGCIIESEGIRKLLIQFIYFEYIRETQLNNTTNGTAKNSAELGQMAQYKNNILKAYNEAVDNVHAVQWFISSNRSIYPLYNGVLFKYIGIV